MRLLLVGSDKVYAIENFYAKYLREKGVEVFHFSAQSIFYDYYQKNIFNKIVFKSGFSNILKQINEQFVSAVNAFHPDVIWIFKGMEIYPESLQRVKAKNIKLVNYNPDNPFIFSGKGSGNANVKNSIALYDLHLTYNTEVKKEIEKTYNIPAAILPFGYDVSEALFSRCSETKEINKACFLGNPDKFRGIFLQGLAENGIELDVFGNHWNKFIRHSNITIHQPVYGDEFWNVLRKYRVQINLSRPHTQDTHNMRSFEVPGIGGIQLAPDTDDHRSYFENEKEIFVYDGLENCTSLINQIVSFTDDHANEIRTQARRRSVQSGYSYRGRAGQAFEQIKILLGREKRENE